MSEKKVITVKELQPLLGIGRDTAYSLMRSRAFPSMRIGNRYFVSEDALDRWLRSAEGKSFLL